MPLKIGLSKSLSELNDDENEVGIENYRSRHSYNYTIFKDSTARCVILVENFRLCI